MCKWMLISIHAPDKGYNYVVLKIIDLLLKILESFQIPLNKRSRRVPVHVKVPALGLHGGVVLIEKVLFSKCYRE